MAQSSLIHKATLTLQKPSANTTSIFHPQSEEVFFLDFSTSDTLLSRDGEDLAFGFTDGSNIILENFYNSYTSANLPDFEIEGAVIDGETFFAVLDATDIMPATGPQIQTVTSDGSFVEHNNASLMEGVDSFDTSTTEFPTVEPGEFLISETSRSGDSVVPEAEPEAEFQIVIPGGGNIIVDEGDITPKETLVTTRAFSNSADADDAEPVGETSVWTPPAGFTIVGAEDGEYGSVVIDADGNLVYTLDHNFDHEGEDVAIGADTIIVTLRDAAGNLFEVKVTVDITDDVPIIVDSTYPTDVIEGADADGHIDIDFGADTKGSSITVEDAIDLGGDKYELANGTVQVNADSTYTFTANPNAEEGASQDIVFIITDGDGDVIKYEITIDINQAEGPVDGSYNTDVSVDEGGLDDAGDSSETVTWVPPAGFTIVGTAGNALGTVTMDADGNLVYTLNDNITHSGAGEDTAHGADTITVTLEDADGNRFEVEVSVDMKDDVPVITGSSDPTNITEGSSVSGDIDVDFGADGSSGTNLGNSMTVKGATDLGGGKYELANGTVQINADGTYTFTANPNAAPGASQDITFVITDGDGDTVEHKITIDVDQADGPADGSYDTSVSVDEGGLGDAGDHSETTTWAPPAGFTIVGTAGSTLGTVTIDANGNLVYTLNDNITHGGAGEDTASGADTITVTVEDADGNKFEVEVSVDVTVDDAGLNDGRVIADVSDSLINTGEGDDALTTTGKGIDSGIGDVTGDDIAILGGGAHDTIWGTQGNDFIDGDAGMDTIRGDIGNDIIVYDPADVLVDGGSGLDILLVENGDTLGSNASDFEVIITGIDSGKLNDNFLEDHGITVNDDSSITLEGDAWATNGENIWVHDSGVTITGDSDIDIILAAG